ncbi:MAG TPA: hypothetical protein ACHBX0_11945 [Arsenophonus sp.]
MERDTLIGVPINAMSLNAHVVAMEKAMNDLSQGCSVDVGSLLEKAEFLLKRVKEEGNTKFNLTDMDNAFDEEILSHILTLKLRDKVQIANDEMSKTEGLVTGNKEATNFDVDYQGAELAIKDNPHFEIDFMDEIGNTSRIKATDLYDEVNRQVKNAKHDASLFDVAIRCFLGR